MNDELGSGRLKMLEKRVSRLGVLTLALGVLVVGQMAWAVTSPDWFNRRKAKENDVLEFEPPAGSSAMNVVPDMTVRELTIVDSEGQPRIRLGVQRDGPYIRLEEGDGLCRLGLMGGHHPTIVVGNGAPAVALAVHGGSPHLWASDESGTCRVWVGIRDDGEPYSSLAESK